MARTHAPFVVDALRTHLRDGCWLGRCRAVRREEDLAKNKRIKVVLREIRKRSALPPTAHVHIVSENNFPTAAGLASSAAGYACLGAWLPTLKAFVPSATPSSRCPMRCLQSRALRTHLV